MLGRPGGLGRHRWLLASRKPENHAATKANSDRVFKTRIIQVSLNKTLWTQNCEQKHTDTKDSEFRGESFDNLGTILGKFRCGTVKSGQTTGPVTASSPIPAAVGHQGPVTSRPPGPGTLAPQPRQTRNPPRACDVLCGCPPRVLAPLKLTLLRAPRGRLAPSTGAQSKGLSNEEGSKTPTAAQRE